MLGLLRRRKTVIFNNVLIIKRTEDVRIIETGLLRYMLAGGPAEGGVTPPMAGEFRRFPFFD